MKFIERHPFADPFAAARKIIEIANGVAAAQNGRISLSASMNRLWWLAAVAGNSLPVSNAPLRWAGFGGVRAVPARSSPIAVRRCLLEQALRPLQHPKHCIAGGLGIREGVER
jgi:hypothetical protein